MIRKIILKFTKGPEIAYIFPSDDQLIIQVLEPELQKEVEVLVNRISKQINLPVSTNSEFLNVLAENLSVKGLTLQGRPVSAYYFEK